MITLASRRKIRGSNDDVFVSLSMLFGLFTAKPDKSISWSCMQSKRKTKWKFKDKQHIE